MLNELTDKYPPATWRLLISPAQDGATNMAIDEAILTSVAMGESLPTLRFYSWQPACLSLGYGQRLESVNLTAVTTQGWHLVRRLTGGRAILHTDELTYSVTAPDQEPRVRGGVLESYRRLSRALTQGLFLLGVHPTIAPPPQPGQPQGAACFDAASNYEIAIDGRKLIGSAQVRQKGVVLQHGTLPLTGDIGRVVRGLRYENEVAQEADYAALHRQATTLAEHMSVAPEGTAVAAALADGFAQALQLQWQPGELTPIEKAHAEKLRAEKYAHPSWTNRR